jgi:hypothetical protein
MAYAELLPLTPLVYGIKSGRKKAVLKGDTSGNKLCEVFQASSRSRGDHRRENNLL